MTLQAFRLKGHGQIDRFSPLKFRFDGKLFEGYRGDTLASALLANGIHLVGRSFKYHRPRGIMTAGAEEPNALVQLGEGNRTDPNLRATQIELYDGLRATSQNRWPCLHFDIGSINDFIYRLIPAGFYYKTFMWPSNWWLLYEHWIRKVAGLGKAPTGRDPDRYEKMHIHCDVLIIGGGPAGLAAALSAGRTGARVLLVEEEFSLGGSLSYDTDSQINGGPVLGWVKQTIATLETMPEVHLLRRTTATGYYDHNYLTLLERVTDHFGSAPDTGVRQRLWKVRAKQVILATGAIERPLVFMGNDKPGIMLSSAVRSYVNRFKVTPGNNILIFTNNDDAYHTALSLKNHHINVAGIADLRPNPEGTLIETAAKSGIHIFKGFGIVSTQGHYRIRSAQIMEISFDDNSNPKKPVHTIKCDAIAVSGGWTPTNTLFSQSGGKLKWDEKLNNFTPHTSLQKEVSVGACNNAITLRECIKQGLRGGIEAARKTGHKGRVPKAPTVTELLQTPPRMMWVIPGRRVADKGGKYFVDFQNDVTVADINLAAREGYRSIEHLKRYTTTGMGTDQGKTSNINALAIISNAINSDISNMGHTTFRPPFNPATFGAYAGREIGSLFDAVRTTPMDSWHLTAGAKSEHVGQWMRAWYYPKSGETMREAVNREALAARTSIGILDATTLGKIDIQGPDAAKFLNLIYTNSWTNLQEGKARYGIMLKEDGMVMDDGVTTRLSENHFHMTTTTGGANTVLDWLEEWLQTEWPNLRVYINSVTEQWAVASICGPNSRKLLAELCSNVDLSNESFPFMSMREGIVAGIPARVFRISFSGELGYEINVPRRYGLTLWNALMSIGSKYDICPYGTETMHLLRAEKGFIIVGQETDGTVTISDLGMNWIINKNKDDFIGKRALDRSDMRQANRKQLIGLLTENPNDVIPEGAQIVDILKPTPPMTMIGHVTSSYYSPNCKRSIAMALVKGGRNLIGKTVTIPLMDTTLRAVITEPKFYDPKGDRIDG